MTFFLFFCLRYPFHGQEHTGLFAKIRRGHFTLPDSLSSRSKCLIRCLLRKDPAERLTTEDVLAHPWLTHVSSSSSSSGGGGGGRSKHSRASQHYHHSATSSSSSSNAPVLQSRLLAPPLQPASSAYASATAAAAAAAAAAESAASCGGPDGAGGFGCGASYGAGDQAVPEVAVFNRPKSAF